MTDEGKRPRVVAAGWIDDEGRVSGGWGRMPRVDLARLKTVRDERGWVELLCPNDHLAAVVTTDTPTTVEHIAGTAEVVPGELLSVSCHCHQSTRIEHDRVLALLTGIGALEGRRPLRVPWVRVSHGGGMVNDNV